MGLNLVVIPFHDWKKCEREGFRTRDAHFMQEFAKHPDIDMMLVIDRPISISEMALYRRNLKVKNGELIYKRNGMYLSKISEKVYVLDIFIAEIFKPLLMKRDWTSYVFGKEKVYRSLITAFKFLGIEDDYSLFISQPLFVPLVKKLSPEVLALDALDNLLKHAMYKDVKGLGENYQYCLDHADLIYTNSKETAEWFAETRADAVYIPNGVDDKVFNNMKQYPLPEDIVDISSPIIGYAGKMQEIFDVDMTEEVISEMPNTSFVFIGQKLNPKWTEKLWNHPNTHYLGDKPYSSLPQYLSKFDVCIIPINVSRQHGGEPIKMYEYLAMGKPMVTTRVSGSEMFKDYPQVLIADSKDQFINDLNFFIDKIINGQEIKIRKLPDSCLWKTKADKIVNSIFIQKKSNMNSST